MRSAFTSTLIVVSLCGLSQAGAAGLGQSPPEKDLLAAIAQGKLIRAREKADKLLKANPQAIIARFALATVYAEEEGNLPRALYHIGRTIATVEGKFGRPPQQPDARHWHRRFLLLKGQILGEMDRRKAQLKLFDEHDRYYTPKITYRRVWPLMKLHRFDEAVKIATKDTLAAELGRRVSGYNGLLSIEFERARPEDCYRVAKRALEATAQRSCILLLNSAEAAFAVFRFKDVEKWALKALQATLQDCPSSSHQHLANLYLTRGDFGKAIAAVKDARKQKVSKRMRQQFEMTNNAWLVRLLYALGQFDKAYPLAERVIRDPDRVGYTSFSPETMEVIYLVDFYATKLARIEYLREKASVRPFGESLKLWAEAKREELGLWIVRRKVARILASKKLLMRLMRPYLKPIASWNLPLLARMIGSGVAEATMVKIRRFDQNAKGIAPYFDAIRAGLAHQQGNWKALDRYAKKALARLPKEEALLAGHINGWRADAALKRNRSADAAKYLDRLLSQFPTVLRIYGIRLPVKVEATKHPLAKKIAQKLSGARRLKVVQTGGLGFTVYVRMQGTVPEVCLNGPQGKRYACASPEAKPDYQEPQLIVAALDAFQQKVFAPLIDLTQQDINSLDGSAVRGQADRVLKEAFGK